MRGKDLWNRFQYLETVVGVRRKDLALAPLVPAIDEQIFAAGFIEKAFCFPEVVLKVSRG